MQSGRGRITLKFSHVLLAALCITGFAWMEWLALNQWMAGRWFLADVGNIQYCLVNTWHGKFMYSELDEGNFLASHFSPFLLLLLPIIWLSDFPVPLVTAYQLALALTPIPLFIMARQRGLPWWTGLATGFWFLANHFTGSLELSNHFEAFYVLFALSTFAAFQSKVRYLWLGFAIAAISVKEDCAGWMLGYAIWEWLFNRKKPLIGERSVMLGIICVAWLAVAGLVLWWQAQSGTNNAVKYIDRMGGISLGKDSLLMPLTLTATSAVICLVDWRAALLLLIPLPVILGNFEFTRNLLYYYSYPFLPFLAFATIAGLTRIHNLWGNRQKTIMVALTILLVMTGLIQLTLPTRTDGNIRWPVEVTSRDTMRRRVMADAIPANAPVAAQFGLWGVLPWRANTVLLKAGQIKDQHYLAIDQFGNHGLPPEEFSKLQDFITDEVDSGRRKIVKQLYDFIIVSPADNRQTSGGLQQP